MAVLTIQYPSEMPPVRYAVGIDLGTTHSLVACDVDGHVQILTDENNEALLPSVVHYSYEGDVIVGYAAKALEISHPDNTIASIKRLIGRTPQEFLTQCVTKRFAFVDETATVPEILLEKPSIKVTPIEVSAQILKKLLERVRKLEQKIGLAIKEAVITVPAYFDEGQRQATIEAARLAGISVLRLINEPTAAALAYGLDKKAEGYCLIYDFGGGTFDVSLLELSQGIFEVRATGGDTALGGDDIDEMIAGWIKQHLDPNLTINASELMAKARLAKESLSNQEKVLICLNNGWEKTFSRTEFEKLIQPLVDKTLKRCHQVMLDAKLAKTNIDHIILVGGSTRIPFVRTSVARFFEKQPLTDLDPDKIVAIGAAFSASALVGNRKEENILLLDVVPLSLGIEMIEGTVEKIIARNTPIPVCEKQVFTTYQDGQTGLSFHIVQGERELSKDCRSLARFDLMGIPPMRAGMAKIEVSFNVDTDGLLSVKAQELTSGVTSEIQVKPTFGLSQEEVSAAIEDSIAHAQTDLKMKKLHEKILSLSQLLASLEKAFKIDSALLSLTEQSDLLNNIAQAKIVLENKQPEEIKQMITILTPLAHAFGERRLNQALKNSLADKKISDLEKI